MRGSIRGGLAAIACLATAIAPAVAAAKPKPSKTKTTTKNVFVVCKHGCRYTTIQRAVNASGKHATIQVKPGTYSEGVVVQGHRHDGLTIEGTGKTPSAVYLNGTHARVQGNAAQNAIEGANVNDLTLENMKEQHYAANGFFIKGCHGYLMKNLIAGFNHAYGMYVFRCVGGRMTQSVGFGNGDSAFYIGGTPFQRKPVWSSVDHDTAYKNVLGYSGTNSKYVRITKSMFYNNGAGVVPNTLSSEPFQPASTGVIANNKIFWNDFDYYRPNSPVKTVSSGLGPGGALNYPIGAGVILFGTTGWVVKHNQIFGNWLWGGAAFSDPTNPSLKAMNNDNRFIDNQMGHDGKDPNGVDFFNDGSGRGTCFANNGSGLTLQTSSTDPNLYEQCPTTAGTGTVNGDGTQVALLLGIAGSNPPTAQEKFWHKHPHTKIKGIRPFRG
ncbi:MAG TPA: hypothetical protein VFW09_07415 [Solirubrobacteraceae bacterium]|nr:hypothetical protein [Solirubrobacteraceae bacterium]